MSAPYVISVLSGKGGVGKTTISLNLAKQLSRRAPVWLIDIDLFNRGATSAMWVSEKDLPLSVARLILDIEDDPDTHVSIEKMTALFESRLIQAYEDLRYDDRLTLIPAARAAEGRAASYFLWRGLKEVGVYAEAFLEALVNACGRLPPGCIVILDGHGGLDELSIAAALVSDICFIVNEPDLITFTGSVTLYREIAEQAQNSDHNAWVEFITNRVSPHQKVASIEADFGPMLDAMSPAKEAVAAYFPLEPELFGVFGDDPFVAELYTRYWFSRKIDLLAEHVAQAGIRSGKLNGNIWRRPPLPPIHPDTRTAVRREFHKRGDALLKSWLSSMVTALVIAVWKLLELDFTVSTGPPAFLWFVLSGVGLFLLVQTGRWLGVQREHLANVRRLRGQPGRRLRLGASRIAEKQDAFEDRQKRRSVKRPLIIALSVFLFIGALVAIAVPNYLTALQRSRQKRTMADMRSLATATEARATDVNEYPADDGSQHLASSIAKVLEPTYIKKAPVLDGWGHPIRYYSMNGQQSYAFVAAGQDGVFEFEDIAQYPVFVIKDGRVEFSKPRPTSTFSDDIVFSDGAFAQYPEGIQSQ